MDYSKGCHFFSAHSVLNSLKYRLLRSQSQVIRNTGEGEHLFFDVLKLFVSANPNFFIAARSDAVLCRGLALLALLR
jgi:hypothetical protein